ncbi:MAG: hypothetical protein Kow00109_10410 [Acidobacteriota bacterium]
MPSESSTETVSQLVEALERRDAPKAQDLVGRILDQTPGPEAAVMLANAVARVRAPEGVRLGMDVLAAESARGKAAAEMALARVEAAQGRWEEAVRRLEELAARRGSVAGLSEILGEVYAAWATHLFREERTLESLATARKARQWAPESPDVRHVLGIAYFGLRQDSDARRELEEAVRLAPERADYWYDLALVCLRLEDLEGAERALQRVLALRPELAMAHLLLGRVYHNQSRTESALQEFAAAERLAPKLRSLHYHIGFAYKAMGDNERAIGELEKEVAFHPDHIPARMELGELYVKANRPEQAIPHLQAVLEKVNSADVYYAYGKALHEVGRSEEALKALQEASRLDPEMSEPYYLKAQIYMKLGDRQAAQQELAMFRKVKRPK